MMIQFEVSWDVTPGVIVAGYQRFGRPFCIHVQDEVEDGGSMEIGNVGILTQYYTASQSRRPRLD
jgi:hypothetical protein